MYTKLNLKQGSPEWLEARFNYVTASQVPVLEDVSPYQTRLQLFEEKVMKLNVSDATKRNLFAYAHDLEEKCREQINEEKGLSFEPAVITNNEVPDLLASLDGIDEEQGIIFEAKYVGNETLKKIINGDFPVHHVSQMQSQLLASGFDRAIYGVTNGKEFRSFDIKSDKEHQKTIQAKVIEFMNCVRKGEAPEPSAKDYFEPQDAAFERLFLLKKLMDEATEDFEKLKAELSEKYKEHNRIKYGDLTMIRTLRKGNINYSKIDALKDVDLEQYRGNPISSVSIKLARGKK